MIEEPSEIIGFSFVLIPMFSGMIIFFFLNTKPKYDASQIPTLVIVAGIALSLVGASFTIIWDDDYKSRVDVLINDSNCSDLPMLAVTYKRFEDKIVNRIVFECLNDSNYPELAKFVKENFNG